MYGGLIGRERRRLTEALAFYVLLKGDGKLAPECARAAAGPRRF